VPLDKYLNIQIIILSVVLYGCETWSLSSREKYILRVFENKMLRKIFLSKGDEMVAGSIKLHKEKLCNLCCSPNRTMNSGRISCAGHVARFEIREMITGFCLEIQN
jgi:hypothetical protein